MTKQEAYDFFLASLATAILTTQDALECVPADSLQYDKLHEQDPKLQRLLMALNDIANAI